MTKPDSPRGARSRRAFLRTVGGAATALPFYRLLEASAVEAAEAPLRFLTWYVPHGISGPLYRRQTGETDTSFDLKFTNSVLAPLDDAATYGASFKDKVTIVEGIDLAAGVEKSTNGHDASCVILTGCAPSGQQVGNESLDQFLAVTKGLGSSTRFASVVLGVGNKETNSGKNLSYSGSGAPISKVIDPTETYKMLFANLMMGTDPGAQAAAERARKRGMSVLDNVRAEIARLQTRLAGPEKIKLDQHLASLRELEKRLAATTVAGGGGPGCKAPAAPNAAQDFPKTQIYNGGEPYLDKITDLQLDFLAMAFACDLTRFATLFNHLTEDVHNEVAHQFSEMNPTSVQKLGDINRYYVRKLARLLGRLRELGILDDTLVYVSSDMGDPNLHSLRNVPTILAGGLGGKLKMGRRLVVKNDATSNNKLLVSIANAFGVPISKYGAATDQTIVNGALTELG